MSGKEAADFTLSMISDIISIIDTTSQVYEAVEDEACLPTNFKKSAIILHLISNLLEDAEIYVKVADKATQAAFTPILEDCKAQATQLQMLFEKVMPGEGEAMWDRYVRAASTIGKDGRVEILLGRVLDDLQLLATRVPELTTPRQKERLAKAVEKVSYMEPSLPDNFDQTSVSVQYSSGLARQHDYPQEENQHNIGVTSGGAGVHLGNPQGTYRLQQQVLNSNTGSGSQYISAGSITVNNQNISLFGSLAMVPSGPRSNETTRAKLANKARYQSGRQLPKPEIKGPYIPYATVNDRRVKLRLLQIAHRFQFLDRGFAEYFREVVPSFNEDQVQQLLSEARESIASRQYRDSDRMSDPDSIYLGDLGDFCEETALTWKKPPPSKRPEFEITYQRDHEILRYLQDAFEVPYWEFMLDLFLGWRANARSLSAEVVLCVLDSQSIDLQDDLRRLHADLVRSDKDDKEGIQPILNGIDERLAVLKSVLDSTASNPEGREDFLSSVFESMYHAQSTTSVEDPLSSEIVEFANRKDETVVLIAVIILFLIGSILPGYKAFAISMKSDETGSTGDADFWYLVQSSIMSVLGNLISVVPLVKGSWFSPAYNVMWLFFIIGLASSAVSIGIYPFLNTGWSSAASFLGSIFSVASVLVMTQATGKDRRKVKMD